MSDLTLIQYGLIALVFIWSGFVRSGLGFGGAVLSLPFLLLIDNRPLVYLPIISVHLLFFSSLTVFYNNRKGAAGTRSAPHTDQNTSTVDWIYLRKAMGIMIVPKLIGVLGLITLPTSVMSGIIFTIVAAYSITYILNRPFVSKSKTLDTVFLMLGAYISGTSLIGAPLIIAVFGTHVARHQLRDTLFTLWFILVSIKMTAFVWAGIDLQLLHALLLLPAAAIGHVIGLRLHERLLQAESRQFFRGLGAVLLLTSIAGLMQAVLA
jgi:uncharacterized membrane protein YfcA